MRKLLFTLLFCCGVANAEKCYSSITFPTYNFGFYTAGGSTMRCRSNLQQFYENAHNSCISKARAHMRRVKADGNLTSAERAKIYSQQKACVNAMRNTRDKYWNANFCSGC